MNKTCTSPQNGRIRVCKDRIRIGENTRIHPDPKHCIKEKGWIQIRIKEKKAGSEFIFATKA